MLSTNTVLANCKQVDNLFLPRLIFPFESNCPLSRNIVNILLLKYVDGRWELNIEHNYRKIESALITIIENFIWMYNNSNKNHSINK